MRVETVSENQIKMSRIYYSFNDDLHYIQCFFSFRERNATSLKFAGNQSLLVFEACNFASNLAYYQLNTALASHQRWNMPRQVVRGLAQSSAGLALGSAFWHGSHTGLGGVADTSHIRCCSYIK